MPVKAKKGPMNTIFSDMVWRNMGSNKNGWVPVKEAAEDSQPLTPPNDLGKTPVYKDVIGQAQGLEKDGLLEKALAKFREAFTIKETKAVATKIAKLEAKVEDLKAYTELKTSGLEAMKEGEIDTALTLLRQAQEIMDTDEIKGFISDAEAAELN